MSYKLRCSLLAVMMAFMVLLLMPYGALAASSHSLSITKTSGLQGVHKSTKNAMVCGTVTSPTVCEYAYIYDLSSETVPMEGDVKFDSNGPMTAGISHSTLSTTDTATITVATAGIYQVTYIVTSIEPSQFALRINGTNAPETVYSTGNSHSQNVGKALITVPLGGATITLRNHTSRGMVELLSGDGGTQSNVRASITLQQVGELPTP